MKRTAYVLPKYDPQDSEHFAHIPHLLAELARVVELTVVVEKGGPPPGLEHAVRVVVQRHAQRSRVRRVVELVSVALDLRRAGVRHVFVRYSRTAATVLLLTRPLTRLRVAYWASGQSDHGRSTRAAERVRHAVSDAHFRWIVRHVDTFVTGPESMVDYMASRWGIARSRIGLAYNDVDTAAYAPAAPDEREMLRASFGWGPEFVVLFVHHLSPRRGSDLLVPTVRLVREAGVPIRLVVAGGGPALEHLRAEVVSAGLEDAVDVLGPVPNRELPAYYRAADCFLMPSYEEGFPRVVLEAMATQLPVVACDAGGTRDLLPAGYPHVVPVGDVDELAASVVAIARDGGGVDAGALRSRVEQRFSTQAVARMYAALVPDA